MAYEYRRFGTRQPKKIGNDGDDKAVSQRRCRWRRHLRFRTLPCERVWIHDASIYATFHIVASSISKTRNIENKLCDHFHPHLTTKNRQRERKRATNVFVVFAWKNYEYPNFNVVVWWWSRCCSSRNCHILQRRPRQRISWIYRINFPAFCVHFVHEENSYINSSILHAQLVKRSKRVWNGTMARRVHDTMRWRSLCFAVENMRYCMPQTTESAIRLNAFGAKRWRRKKRRDETANDLSLPAHCWLLVAAADVELSCHRINLGKNDNTKVWFSFIVFHLSLWVQCREPWYSCSSPLPTWTDDDYTQFIIFIFRFFIPSHRHYGCFYQSREHLQTDYTHHPPPTNQKIKVVLNESGAGQS